MPVASNTITFAVTAGAAVIGTGNGNPASHTPDKSLVREAFNGLALAVVQSTVAPAPAGGGAAEATDVATVTVTATSPGLRGSSLEIALLPGDVGGRL